MKMQQKYVTLEKKIREQEFIIGGEDNIK